MTELQSRDDGSWVCPTDPGEPGYGTPRVSVTDEEGALLTRIATGRRVLEIGTGLGVSTRYLAKGAAELVTCDVDPWVHAHVWPSLDASIRRVADVAELGDGFDMVFVDGNHEPASVVRDSEQARQKLHPGGFIVFHDTNSQTIRGVLESIGLTLFTHRTAHGLGVVYP